ncbi:PP2C family protein-serine/threonine phosphatase [Kitasatospora purpeofusca]|uniref:PP2C family protein-serine/threonine phosphatase n=1 Tax=Kitasatospora purpeofusca TaxID=67352 RepID=UPI002253E1A8|nr:PP2C family protein-serine/threonine phosphatase [Kitasatospora purpeofusca]MCX4688818.1 serine/threonine-protein phosphatase [Kitasatospora purpeofusca]
MPLRQHPDDRRPHDRRRSWTPDRRALTAVPLALIVVITVVDVLAPPDIHLGPLLIVAPALTASLAGARATTVVALLSLAALTVIGILRDGLTTGNHETQLGALLAVSALIVALRVLRDRHERELAQVRSVSEAAQRVLLRPLPDRTGPLHLASFYLAAEAEAQVGGDLYAAARTATGTRLLVGDVRGKGLSSLGDAALLLGAFRAAAHLYPDLPDLVGHLDGSIAWDLAQLAEQQRAQREDGVGDRPRGFRRTGPTDTGAPPGTRAANDGRPDPATDDSGESFITAVVLDVPDDGAVVRLVDCGHPPPLLLHGDRVTALEPRRTSPPLGLGDLVAAPYVVEEFAFLPGDRLLIYTDGVIEARDSERRFYPLTERVAERTAAHPAEPPAALLLHLRRDLLAHAGGRLDDDAAMVVVERIR